MVLRTIGSSQEHLQFLPPRMAISEICFDIFNLDLNIISSEKRWRHSAQVSNLFNMLYIALVWPQSHEDVQIFSVIVNLGISRKMDVCIRFRHYRNANCFVNDKLHPFLIKNLIFHSKAIHYLGVHESATTFRLLPVLYEYFWIPIEECYLETNYYGLWVSSSFTISIIFAILYMIGQEIVMSSFIVAAATRSKYEHYMTI